MPTNAEFRNNLSRLLGGDASSEKGARDLLGKSVFASGNLEMAEVQGGLSSAKPYANHAYTHFLGRTIPGMFTLTEEGTTTAAATYGTGLGGTAVITSDDVAAKTDQLTTGLCWQPDRQPSGYPLIAEVRWKTGATITASEYWIGLTDAAPDTDPIALSTSSTFTTSVPTDGVYMGYSATPTSGAAFTTGGNKHTAIAIKADANTLGTSFSTPVVAGVFAANTYYIYTFEMDADGTTRFYIDGALVGTQSAAVTATVPLCLMICASPRTTVSAAITVDYALIAGA